MKKNFFLPAILLAFALSVTALANTTLTENNTIASVSDESNGELIGLSIANENTRGLDIPTESAGKSCSFSGSAKDSTLYTNKYVTGATSYTIQVTNNSSKDLEIKVKKIIKGADTNIKTVTIPANGSTTFTLTGLDSSDKIYIQFSAPSNFKGSIAGK